MAAIPSGSITALLEKSLDLISNEICGGPVADEQAIAASAGTAGKTAASTLLEERRKAKRSIDMVDNFIFQASKKPSTTGGAPLLEQISSSAVDPPKYCSSSRKNKRSSQSSNVRVCHGKIKGENYSNRQQEKLAVKAAKAKFKNKLKSS